MNELKNGVKLVKDRVQVCTEEVKGELAVVADSLKGEQDDDTGADWSQVVKKGRKKKKNLLVQASEQCGYEERGVSSIDRNSDY